MNWHNKTKEKRMKDANPIIKAIKKLATQHGEDMVLYACRRWIEMVTDRKQLLKKKSKAERALQEIKEKLGEQILTNYKKLI